MTYKIAERFKSLQGEGVYTGTPMAFIRFCGCSVGKTICQHCDTDFDTPMPWRGGGEFTALELRKWVGEYEHVCLTGGEPLDTCNDTFFMQWRAAVGSCVTHFHIETSGTKPFERLREQSLGVFSSWVCVSPKPGFLEDVVMAADEVKVIVPGLGEINEKNPKHWDLSVNTSALGIAGTGVLKHWPTLADALRWAAAGKTVFLQPRNSKNEIDKTNLMYVMDLLRDHPQLRLSSQMHKILKVQ